MRKTFALPLNLQLFSDEMGSAETGVDSAPAAEVPTETFESADSQPGVESQAAAEPEKQNNFEKAFAKRLAAKEAEIEARFAEKYKDYDAVKSVAEYFKEVNQAQDIMSLKEQIELQRLQERADQQGIPPEMQRRLEELESKAEKAEAYEKEQAQAKEYSAFREDLDKFASEKGVSSDDLYTYMVENNVGSKEVAYKALRAEQLEQQLETAKKDAVKEYLASKQAPKAEGAGAAGHVTVDTSKMSWNDVSSHALAKLQAKIIRE